MANRSAHLPCPRCKQRHTVVRHGFLKHKRGCRFRCKRCFITYSHGSPNTKRNMDEVSAQLPGWIAEYGIRGLARLMEVSPTTILRRRGKTAQYHKKQSGGQQKVLSHKNWKYIG